MNATTTTDTAQDPRLVRYLTTCHVYTPGEMRTGTCGKPAASIGATTSNRGTHDAPVPVVEYEPTCKFHVSVANRRNRRYGWSQPNHAWLALDDATAVEALTHEWRERTAADERRKADEREANKKRWIASRDRAIAESKVRYLTLDRPDYEVDYEKADRLTREGYDRDDARQEARIAKPRWLVVDEEVAATEAEVAARQTTDGDPYDFAWKATNTIELVVVDQFPTTVRMRASGQMNPSEARATAAALLLAAAEVERRNG
jgi:hypothetical protein